MQVQAATEELMAGSRPSSSPTGCPPSPTDRILVFDRGRIVQEGTHRELLERDSVGMFGRLWRHQSGGFLAE